NAFHLLGNGSFIMTSEEKVIVRQFGHLLLRPSSEDLPPGAGPFEVSSGPGLET
ncbi:hypothetical protein M9458_048177, partial [Cirrhinus mrigala]